METNKEKYQRLLSKVKEGDKKLIEGIAAGIAEKVSASMNTSNKRLNQDLRQIFADLSVEIATLNTALQGHRSDQDGFDRSFNKLADSLNKKAIASLSDAQITELARSVGEKVSDAIEALNINLAAQQVEVKGLDSMLNKLVDKIPDSIDGEVTLAYNKKQASNYVNVRLTDGQNFIESIVSASRGPGLPLIAINTGGESPVMALPVVNADGTPIGGASGGLTDTELRASPVDVNTGLTQPTTPSDTQPVSAASLPLPSGAATSSKQDTGNASLGSIDTKTKDTPTTVRNGQKTVAVTNSAVAIVPSSTPVLAVIIQALASNANNIKVGDSSVVSGTGFELQPGQAVGLAIDNLNKVYINGTAADGVCFLGS